MHSIASTTLSEFKAEAKRSWYSPRQALTSSVSRGELWQPITLTLSGGYARISSAKETQEFRPRRLEWKGTNQFSISGLGERARLKRIVLRFATQKEAQLAAAAVLEMQGPTESVPPAGTGAIPVEVRFLTPRAFWVIVLLFLIPYLLPLVFLLTNVLGAVAFIIFLVLVLTFRGSLRFWIPSLMKTKRGWLGSSSASKPVKGRMWLEGLTVIIGTDYQTRLSPPSRILWKSPTSFTVESEGSSLELTFSKPELAAEAIEMIRTSYPLVKEESSSV